MTTNMRPQISERREYDLLPADTYNVVIESIDDDKRTKYMSEEEEDYMKFTFKFTDKGYEDRKMWANATPKLFRGDTGLSASTLYSILSSVNNRTYTEEELEKVATEDINALEGKSLRILVKQAPNKKGDMRNKIEAYLPSKNTPSQEPIEQDETVDVSAIPF